MSEPARRPATYQDVLDAPDDVIAEIIAGELHLSPRPSVAHQQVTSAAGGEIWGRFGRRRGGDDHPGGWVILTEPEVHLGRPDPRTEVVVPDLAGWRRERLAEAPRAAAVAVRPDWVAEVLSPGPRNVRRDRLLKAEAYARAGVPHLWLIDPAARLVEVFRLHEGSWLRVATAGADDLARLEPFEAVALDLSEWWLPDEVDREG